MNSLMERVEWPTVRTEEPFSPLHYHIAFGIRCLNTAALCKAT